MKYNGKSYIIFHVFQYKVSPHLTKTTLQVHSTMLTHSVVCIFTHVITPLILQTANMTLSFKWRDWIIQSPMWYIGFHIGFVLVFDLLCCWKLKKLPESKPFISKWWALFYTTAILMVLVTSSVNPLFVSLHFLCIFSVCVNSVVWFGFWIMKAGLGSFLKCI